MNINKKFIIACYLMMQSLNASQHEPKPDEQAVASDIQKKAAIRKREYHINMLKQYAICLENSTSDETEDLCTQEYSFALAYFQREDKKMHDHQQKNLVVSNAADTQK